MLQCDKVGWNLVLTI